MIFVDTGAFFAICFPKDPNHEKAATWLRSNLEALITTDYIIDEALTLLRARGQNHRAIRFGEAMMSGTLANTHHVGSEEFRAGWDIFRNFNDKSWSFTDCVSRVIMQEFGSRKPSRLTNTSINSAP